MQAVGRGRAIYRGLWLGVISLIFLGATAGTAQAPEIRFLRSLSGPSGKVEGNQFIFDETRTRFTYPQDKSLVVYCEWDAPPGNYTLTGVWKGPDGRALSLSKDINLTTPNRELRAFWQFELNPSMDGGIWTLEIRVNGQPAGTHVFEVILPPPAPAVTVAPPPAPPTIDQIYRKTLPSMVWVYRLDNLGRRIDSSSGFVAGKDRIATAFQAIDSAHELELEFSDGRIVRTMEVWDAHRLQDWAVIHASTLNIPLLERENADVGIVGTRLIVMNADNSKTRAIAGMDISGRQDMPGFPGRIQLSPGLNADGAGGPLLSLWGRVAGIIGGSLTPAARLERRQPVLDVSATQVLFSVSAATPIRLIPENLASPAKTLKMLLDAGVLTPPLFANSHLSYGGVTNTMPKDPNAPMPRNVAEFSRRDSLIWIYTWWQKREKNGKGSISVSVYDAQNRMRIKGSTTKVSLQENSPSRFTFNFSPAKLERGTYRVDVFWENQPVWRTFFTMVD